MEKKSSEVLDQFDEEIERKWFHHWSIFYSPMLLLCIGLIFRVQNWPGARLILAVAMFFVLLRSAIFFFSSSRKWFEWIYFVSRIVLMVTLIYYFGWESQHKKSLVFALTFFAVSVLLYLIKTRKEHIETQEKDEDDY